LALELNDNDPSYTSSIASDIYGFFMSKGINLRPLGNVIYILPPYCITKEELNYIYSSIIDFLDTLN